MPNPLRPSAGADMALANELEKLRLNAEFGVDVAHSCVLPPALESVWLDRVRAAEAELADARRVSVSTLLGSPRFPSAARLSKRRLRAELDRVLDLLEANGIEVRTLHPLPQRDFYRWLTEELIWEPVPEHRPEGIVHRFVCDRFHANDDFDCEHTVVEFFDMLFGGYHAMLESVFWVPSGELVDHPPLVALIDRLCDFADSFDDMVLDDYRLDRLSIRPGGEAELACTVRYTGYPNAGGEGIPFAGPARFRLRTDRYGYWAIRDLEIPGVFAAPEAE